MLAGSSPRTPRKEGVRCRWAGNNPGPSVEKVWRDVSVPSPYPLLRSSVHFNSVAPKFSRIPKSLALSLVFCLGSYPTDPRAHPWLCFWHGIWTLGFVLQHKQEMQELPHCFGGTGLSLGMGWQGNVPGMGHGGWLSLSIAWDSPTFCDGKGHEPGWDV